MSPTRLLLFCLGLALSACSSSSPHYVYRYVPGKTAKLQSGLAVAPAKAPKQVVDAIAAGNRIAGKPYVYGGGHRSHESAGYDCSGAASYILRAAGVLNGGAETSHSFRKYGSSGEGKWITVYAIKGHVFLSVAGLRFDTGWGDKHTGLQWTTRTRPANGALLRHPPGL